MMAITAEQLVTFRQQLQDVEVELSREIQAGQNWPPALLDDYDRKGQAIRLLADIVVAILDEIETSVVLSGSGTPDNNVVANRSGLYVRLTPSAGDRTVWFNSTPGATTGWQLIADRT